MLGDDLDANLSFESFVNLEWCFESFVNSDSIIIFLADKQIICITIDIFPNK